MFNRLCRFILLTILLSSITLAACQPEMDSTPTTGQNQTTTEGVLPSQTATLSPSATPTPTSSPTVTPSITPSPTPTQPWEDISFDQTPLPGVLERAGVANIESILPLAIWGSGSPNGISLSSDGQVLAVATNLGVAFYDSLSYAKLAYIQTALPLEVIAFSADNLQIALGLADGSIDIINRVDYTSQITLPNPYPDFGEAESITVSYSPDSDELFQVIETAESLLIHRWETANWQTIANFTLDSGWTSYTSASLDLLGVITDENLLLQSLTYVEEQDILSMAQNISSSFWNRIVSLGGEVAAASSGEFILINNGIAVANWELLAEKYTYNLDDYPDSVPDPCAQAPDTCRDAVGGFAWSCEDSDTLNPIELIALSPDDIMVLISRNDNLTEFRRVSDSRMLWEIESTFTEVAFSPGGEFFFGLRPDGTIEKRSTLDGTLTDLLNLHPAQLFCIAFSPDGSVIAAGFSDSWIRVYSTLNGEMLGVLTGSARSLGFSPDGALLAAGLEDGGVRIFLLQEGNFFDINPGHLAEVTDMTFSSSGELLLTGSADCTTSLWNIPGAYRVQTRFTSSQTPFQVSQALLGRDQQSEFLSGNLTGITIRSGTGISSTLLPEIMVSNLALSPNGIFLAAAGEGLFLIPIPEAERNNSIQLDEGRSYAAAFDPTGNLLVDATAEAIRIRSVENQTLLAQLPLAAFVSAVNPPILLAFSPGGDLLIMATADGLIQVFGIPIDR